MPVIDRNLRLRRIVKPHWHETAGFSLLELTMTLAVGLILAALAVPTVKSSIQYFRVRSAVTSVTGAIQSTRYRAIFDGCPYNITLNNSGNTLQVASETAGGNSCATIFTKVGTAVPFGSTAVKLNQSVTLQFKPSGVVQATSGSSSIFLTASIRAPEYLLSPAAESMLKATRPYN